MDAFELSRLSAEVARYPAVLAWLQCCQAGQSLAATSVIECLLEEAGEDSLADHQLLELYLDHGETGGAEYLIRREGGASPDRVFRRSAALQQQISEVCLSIRDSMLQIQESNPEDASRLAGRFDFVEGSPLLLKYRPGKAIELLHELNADLDQLLAMERQRLTRISSELVDRSFGNAEAELALKKAADLIGLPEGVALAARYLRVAERALADALSDDDYRMLYAATGDSRRLVRTWEAMRALIGDANQPAAIAEALAAGHVGAGLQLPAEFDRGKLQELLVALSPDPRGRLNVIGVADRLAGFLGVNLDRKGRETKSGRHFQISVAPARHRDFNGIDRKLFLSVPLHGSDASALGQLYKECAALEGGRALPILVYPGVVVPEKPLTTSIGLPPSGELLYLDCIDLLRIAELPLVGRPIALQQVLLPRVPGFGRRAYQTGGPVAAELFRGRQAVISDLTVARGKTVLFSGRMMGKSSVLSRIQQQIESSSPESGSGRCILLSAATGNLLQPLMDRLLELLPVTERAGYEKQRAVVMPSVQDAPDKQVRKDLGQLTLLRSMVESVISVSRLTILVDEADKFAKLDASRDRTLSLAWTLRDLENHAPERLRVIFAGFQTLHHEVVTANGAFANWFGKYKLGPLERDEAIALIREPLADFGVQFVSDIGVERILEFSGRYPLLIQEVCAKVMARVISRRPQQPNPKDELLFLRAGEIEAICRDEVLRNRLKQVLSLNLNEYPRLKLVTYLILQAGANRPGLRESTTDDIFRLADIEEMLLTWYGDKLSEYFSEASLPGLIEELESLGLLAQQGDGYRFLNRTFAAMLRDDPGFESELLDLLGRVANPSGDEPRRYWSLPAEHLETLLRGRMNTLVVGLPATLKSQIVQTLFQDDPEAGSVVVIDPGVTTSDAFGQILRKRFREERKTLSIGDLCVKNKVNVLVVDCPRLPLAELGNVAGELAGREGIRLVCTADVAVTRAFLAAPPAEWQVVPVKRLRPKDIQAWGQQPYTKTPGGKELSIILDETTAAALHSVTAGYFPLVQRFRSHCERVMQRASEYYPGLEQIESFRREVTAKVVADDLLGVLSGVEMGVLRELLDLAKEFENDPLRIDVEFAQEQILEAAQDEANLSARLNAVELLINLDLMNEVLESTGRMYVFEGGRVIDLGLRAD